jgi:hypothetical protein
MAERIQLRRTKGWRKPDGVVVVARPARWGNPWRVGSTTWTILPGGIINREPHEPLTAEQAVESYRNSVLADPDQVAAIRRELEGRDLACWCRVGDPCHGDFLLALANGAEP